MALDRNGRAETEAVTLRGYRAGDWEAMYALDVTCFDPPFRFSRRAMRGFAESRNALCVVAETVAEAEMVGFCIVELEEQVGYVVTLDVAPAWRRRGLAGRLMIEAENEVRAAGGVGMALHVFTGNVGAVRFYEAAGYERAGSAAGFYGRGVDALVYRRRFEA
jgi:ribosomal-protein-alanine N-acetyltransferase